MFQRIDDLLRSRWFWLGLLLAAYFLPSLLAGIPMALAFPWILIPYAYEGLLEACGMRDVYTSPRLTVWVFAIGFHIVIWSLCGLVIFRGRQLPTVWLRLISILLILILGLTVYGCPAAIDAVRH